MAVSTSEKGRIQRVKGSSVTEKERIVYKRIKKFIGIKNIHSIYVHDLGGKIFSIDIYGLKFNEYGFGRVGTQIMYSNILRFVFEDIEISDMENGFYKIGGI